LSRSQRHCTRRQPFPLPHAPPPARRGRSAENTSPVSRAAYSVHYVEGGPGVTWLPDNWLARPPESPWTPLYG